MAKAPSASPWSALLQDNLNPDDVASFLSDAIARKEVELLTTRQSTLDADAPAVTPSLRESRLSRELPEVVERLRHLYRLRLVSMELD